MVAAQPVDVVINGFVSGADMSAIRPGSDPGPMVIDTTAEELEDEE